MTEAAIAGFFSSLSLILAIGAQNAFVLRQGIRREYVALVVAICAISDALLITLGVAGFGHVIKAMPWIEPVMKWAGAIFLLVYGALRFKAGFQGGEALRPADGVGLPLRQVVLTCVMFTWANPHVYLDTVVLLGSISAQYAPYQLAFGMAAVFASFSFFTALGFGARALAPLFAKPKAWVVLEFLIGAVMWGIAAAVIMA